MKLKSRKGIGREVLSSDTVKSLSFFYKLRVMYRKDILQEYFQGFSLRYFLCSGLVWFIYYTSGNITKPDDRAPFFLWTTRFVRLLTFCSCCRYVSSLKYV